MEYFALFLIAISGVALIIMLIWEISDIQCAKAIRKMRKQDERKADEERQLKEKIRSIAKAVCVEDSLAVAVLLRTMKGHE